MQHSLTCQNRGLSYKYGNKQPNNMRNLWKSLWKIYKKAVQIIIYNFFDNGLDREKVCQESNKTALMILSCTI